MKFTANGTEVELSKTEQKLLRILVENQGNIISRSTLVDHIWTDGAEYVDENALSVTIKRLRDKLNAYDNIKTIYGLGYRWENSHE
jgi:DNA-binding response OmpR family regulator